MCVCVWGGGGVICYLVDKKYYLFLDTSFIPQYFCFVVLPCGLVCVLWSCLCIVVLSVYCGLVCVLCSCLCIVFLSVYCGLVCVLWSCLCIVFLSVYCGLVCALWSCLCVLFIFLCHVVIETLCDTPVLPQSYKVKARASWPAVSSLQLDEIASLICNFCLSSEAGNV